MAKSFCIQIPVKPYIRQYLTHKLGANYQLNRGHVIGLHLFGLLRRRCAKREYDDYLLRYTEHFEVKVSRKQALQEGCFVVVPGQLVIDFNTFAEALFHQEYCDFVQLRAELGRTLVSARAEFRQKYDLSELHIPEDNLVRTYQRYRERYDEQTLRVESKSRVFSLKRENSLTGLLPSAA